MSTIGIIQPSLTALPVPAQALPPAALPLPSKSYMPDGIADRVNFDVQAVEQKRVDTVQRAAQQIADVFVVGDQVFSLFKDATGQYVTRFTSLRDGKVTYIPEPTLFQLGRGRGSEPSLTITA